MPGERIVYNAGDLVQMKKNHPCGGSVWEILRVGMDFRIRCKTCGRMVMLPRPQFEKRVKRKIEDACAGD